MPTETVTEIATGFFGSDGLSAISKIVGQFGKMVEKLKAAIIQANAQVNTNNVAVTEREREFQSFKTDKEDYNAKLLASAEQAENVIKGIDALLNGGSVTPSKDSE